MPYSKRITSSAVDFHLEKMWIGSILVYYDSDFVYGVSYDKIIGERKKVLGLNKVFVKIQYD